MTIDRAHTDRQAHTQVHTNTHTHARSPFDSGRVNHVGNTGCDVTVSQYFQAPIRLAKPQITWSRRDMDFYETVTSICIFYLYVLSAHVIEYGVAS